MIYIKKLPLLCFSREGGWGDEYMSPNTVPVSVSFSLSVDVSQIGT